MIFMPARLAALGSRVTRKNELRVSLSYAASARYSRIGSAQHLGSFQRSSFVRSLRNSVHYPFNLGVKP